MKQYGLLWAALLAVMPLCATADSVGYEVVTPQPDGTVIAYFYSDSGVLVSSSQTSPGDPENSFAAPLVITTVYLDTKAFGNALPPASTIIPENFNSPTNLSVSEPLIFSVCDTRFGDCSNPPSLYLPIDTSADGSSISGNVGTCSGVPRCLSPTGWQYGYIVDLHFIKPVIGFAVADGLMAPVNLSTHFYDISLPTDDLFGYGFGGSPDFNGWVFPGGINDVYLDYYGLPGNAENGQFGPMPFTLSNFEIALGPVAPEPSSVLLAVTGLLAMIGLMARRRSTS